MEQNFDVVTKKDEGFTLVELLIVIVILGILSTVTVFAVRGITNQGNTNACSADRRTLQTAVEAYFAQNASSVIPGADPEQTLVSGGFLRNPSQRFNIVSNGNLTLQPGATGANVCTLT